jgi:ribosomal protein L17
MDANDLLTMDGIRALKDNLSSDKYALLENLISELQEIKRIKIDEVKQQRDEFEKLMKTAKNDIEV